MRCRSIAGLILALAAQYAGAQTQSDTDQQRRLVEQKVKLVEMLVNSPKAQASSTSNDPETTALVGQAGTLLRQARDALAAQNFAAASQALDQALQSVSKANNRSVGGLSDSAQRQRLQEMTEQVVAYRASLAELVKQKGVAAKSTLERVDLLAEEGRKLAAAGRLGEANKKMAEAYRLEVEEVSRLRAGQEVVMSLKFDTPADEYAYEQKRFQSNMILVGMMIDEGRAQGERRALVDSFLKDAARLKEDAAALAQSNRHQDAVPLMEKAAVQLNRALQAMGLPAF